MIFFTGMVCTRNAEHTTARLPLPAFALPVASLFQSVPITLAADVRTLAFSGCIGFPRHSMYDTERRLWVQELLPREFEKYVISARDLRHVTSAHMLVEQEGGTRYIIDYRDGHFRPMELAP
jgi:hypothetical protein